MGSRCLKAGCDKRDFEVVQAVCTLLKAIRDLSLLELLCPEFLHAHAGGFNFLTVRYGRVPNFTDPGAGSAARFGHVMRNHCVGLRLGLWLFGFGLVGHGVVTLWWANMPRRRL